MKRVVVTEISVFVEETRSKRLQALLPPSLFREMARFAKRNHVSRNEVVCMALSSFLEKAGEADEE